MISKFNVYFYEHHKLCLGLCLGLAFLAVGIGVTLAILAPAMGFFKFLACIIVPGVLSFYLRLIYSKYQRETKEAETAKRRAEKQQALHSGKKHK